MQKRPQQEFLIAIMCGELDSHSMEQGHNFDTRGKGKKNKTVQ